MRAAKHKRRFTDQMIERLNAPKEGRLEFGDTVCPGLLLRVTDRGVKSFFAWSASSSVGLMSARLIMGRDCLTLTGRNRLLKSRRMKRSLANRLSLSEQASTDLLAVSL
jgi:hypothetical protein